MAKVGKNNVTDKFLTGKGTLTGFICLDQPSTKFNAEGIYSANMLLSKKDGEALAAKLKEVRTEQFKTFGKGSKVTEISSCVPYATIDEETGEEVLDKEGRYILKARRKAKIKDGIIGRKVRVVDAKGHDCNGLKIGEGSIAKEGLNIKGYTVAGKTGVSVDLAVVQIIKLEEYTGGESLDSFGITEEEGFEASDVAEEETTVEADEEDEEEADF